MPTYIGNMRIIYLPPPIDGIVLDTNDLTHAGALDKYGIEPSWILEIPWLDIVGSPGEDADEFPADLPLDRILK